MEEGNEEMIVCNGEKNGRYSVNNEYKEIRKTLNSKKGVEIISQSSVGENSGKEDDQSSYEKSLIGTPGRK